MLTLRVCAPLFPYSVLGAKLPSQARAQSNPGGHRGRHGTHLDTCVASREHQPHARTHTFAHTPSLSSCNNAVDKYREYARLRGAGDDAGGASQGSPRSVGALVSTSSWQTGTQTTDSAVAHTAATNGGAAAAWQGAGEGARGVKRTGAGDAQQQQQQQQPTRSSRRRR